MNSNGHEYAHALHWVSSHFHRYGAPKVTVRGPTAFILASIILWALGWLLYRAYLVFQTPNDVLVDKLGLDIPPAPELALEEIQAKELQIAWKISDAQNSIQKHIIQVNGCKVGESKRTETVVTILNLTPGMVYDIRVYAVSAANFQTPSAPIRARTSRLPHNQSHDASSEGYPTIRACVPRSVSALSLPSAPAMAREHSGGQAQGKRAATGRKQSPSNAGQDPPPQIQSDDPQNEVPRGEADESLEQLAERLKKVQQENEMTEKQICEEEAEHESTLKDLENQRDEAKQKVKERDEATNDLKRQVHKLETANRTAQTERTKKEKLLQQKEAERKKRQDDIDRWDQEASRMVEEVSQTKSDKSDIENEIKQQISDYRQKTCNEKNDIKALEEDIQDKGSQILKLEEERKRLVVGDDSEEAKEADRVEREKDRAWDLKLNSLQAKYTSMLATVNQVQAQHIEAQERLRWFSTRRASTSGSYLPITPLELDFARKGGKQRRTRQRSSLASSISSPIGGFPIDSAFPNAPTFNNSNISPTFASSSAFFNINNGMTLSAPSDPISTTQADVGALTGGAPMSPRADALLPSNLLGDEPVGSDPGMGNIASSLFTGINPNLFSGLGPAGLPFDPLAHGSPSPVSSGSRSASIFSSPRDSLNNLQETDRISAHSANVPLTQAGPSDGPQSASRKLSGLFSFTRQRGKTLADDPPVLGTLKLGQSQSFPRNLEQGLDPIGTRRRRLSHTGGWANPMTSLFPRSTGTGNDTTDAASARIPTSRRSGFPDFFASSRLNPANFGKLGKTGLGDLGSGYNQFSPRHDPIEPALFGTLRGDSSSPRPSSTYSFENQLPRPSTDSQPFGWPAPDKSGLRGSPLGPDWSSPQPWSHSQSRRPSIQYGSTSNLSLGAAAAESDVLEVPHEMPRPLQAPIGTRPSSSQRPVTPKLNPAAPSFKTLFSKKAEKEKDKDKEKVKESEIPNDKEIEATPEESSPPDSRRSKDSRSIATATSMGESYDSLERTPSGTPSETPGQKETFIQKITRKSSSSKFNIPWKDKLSKKGEPSTPGEIDEDASSEGQLGKSVDSVSTTPSGDKGNRTSLSFNFMRKSKKPDKSASESSEKANETGDEEMEEDV